MVSRGSEDQGQWCWLGRVDFAKAAALQERLRVEVSAGFRLPTLLVCEHEPVVTLGRSASRANVLLSPAALEAAGVDLQQASRGGDVTYHGPGQLVAYPIFPLRAGVVAHVEAMAAAVVDVLAGLGVIGRFERAQPGVWVDNAKVCAFGVHVRRRVPIHGLALNVSVPPSAFKVIVPCGLADRRVTSLVELTGSPLTVPSIVPLLVTALSAAFSLPLLQIDQADVVGSPERTISSSTGISP